MSDAVPSKWDASKIPPQKGKTVVITGANSGIGFVAALELARHGAHVVLACRNEERGTTAVKQIQDQLQNEKEAGSVEFRLLDVSSLASVETFANKFVQDFDKLDVLINNAGIFGVPYGETEDGIESHFATNHLGHFALTIRLMEVLKKCSSARIVNVSSVIHRQTSVDANEIVMKEAKYDALHAYAKTKVYNLLFTHEVNRRFKNLGITNVFAVTAHPGLTDTKVWESFFGNSAERWWLQMLMKVVLLLPLSQSVEFGALPILYAAVGEHVKSNEFFGPDGLLAAAGYPTKEDPSEESKSEPLAEKLWQESERLSKLSLPSPSE